MRPRSWFLIPFPNKRNLGFLEKWLILGLGQVIYKMTLQRIVAPTSKEVFKNINKPLTNVGVLQKEKEAN